MTASFHEHQSRSTQTTCQFRAANYKQQEINMLNSQAKLIIVASCLAALIPQKPSDALLLGNFISCNSFGCRLSALESDVAQLKVQIARLTDPQGMQGMNNYRPNGMLPYNQNGMNNQQGQNQLLPNNQQQGTNQQQGGNQQQGTNQQGDGGNTRVNYAPDYPVMNSQNLRRTSGYQNTMTNGLNSNGQFIGI